MDENNDLLKVLAAMVTGDRWLSADSCAVYLGMFLQAEYLTDGVFLRGWHVCQDFPNPTRSRRAGRSPKSRLGRLRISAKCRESLQRPTFLGGAR